MAMNKIILGVSLCAILMLPVYVDAGPIVRSGEKISIDSTQILKGDFYGFAPVVTLSGSADNDVYIGGGTVTVNAPIKEDLTIVGGVVQVHGDVGDDLRVIGGDVTLGKAVKGDVVVLGGSLTVLSTASIEGDVLFLGGNLSVEGDVVGGIHGTSDTVRINSKVGGDILYTATNSFVLGDKADIRGAITYTSMQDIVRAQDAHVTGIIHRAEAKIEANTNLLKMLMLEGCMLLFGSLALFLVCRKRIQSSITDPSAGISVTGLVGLGVFLVLPFVGVIFVVSVVGLFVGIALLVLYVLMVTLALLCSGILAGYYIQKAFTKKTNITLGTVLCGVFGLVFLSVVPVVGGLLLFACVIISLGKISQMLYQSFRP